MKPRSRRIVKMLIAAATAVSGVLCMAAIVLTTFRDQFHRKYFKLGHFESFSHHDVIIVSWRPNRFEAKPRQAWSFDATWIGFDVDVVTVGATKTWVYTLNVTHTAVIIAMAILPGICIVRIIRRRSELEVNP